MLMLVLQELPGIPSSRPAQMGHRWVGEEGEGDEEQSSLI